MTDKNIGRNIRVIDQTLREGMQFQGLVFSLEQRIRILEFQEALGIDVCQAGYPSAHPMEADIVTQLAAHAKKNNFQIRTAALGRAVEPDARILCKTGIDDIHLHFHVKNTLPKEGVTCLLQDLGPVITSVRDQRPGALISMAMLDIGRTAPGLISDCVAFLSQDLGIDILSLPDTSGIMAPNQVYDRIQALSGPHLKANLSVHCHNDMGMASANSVMGILGGASVLEVSALGIGERNGIGDLFTTVKHLQDQGLVLGVDTNNLDLFKQYYGYVDAIVREQTEKGLIHCNTPVFGKAVHTHVAGTHASKNFGTMTKETFYLNLLCGRQLVRKYLDLHYIPHDENKLDKITDAVKTFSITMGRRLTQGEIASIAASVV